VTPATERPGWTFALTSAALFMALLDNLVVTIALPDISRDLDASIEALEWTVNGYALPFAVFLLTGSALGDRFGRRRVFAAGIGVFTVASAACALAPSIEVLLVARAVQGVGAALILPLSLTLVSAAFPGERRGLALGAWSAVGGFAVAIGPLVGGLLVTGLSWQWIFWINVPIGLLVAPLALLRLRESFGPNSKLDLLGLVLVTPGLAAIIAGVARGGTGGWSSGSVIGMIIAGLLLTGAFIAWELRAPAPMLSMYLFRGRAFAAANAVAFLMFFGSFGTIFLLAQFLQTAQGYSALEAGLRALPWTGMPILLSPIAGILAERIGGQPLMAGGVAVVGVALAWLAAVIEPDVAYSKLLFPFLLGGIGMSFFFPPAAVVILGAVRPEEEGQASGVTNALRQLGTVFGIAVLATVFASYGSDRTPEEFADGIGPAIWVASAALGVAFLAALLVPWVRPGKEPNEELATPLRALGGMTPVTSRHAIVSAANMSPRWEFRTVPVAETEGLELGDWEPFGVAGDKLYLRRAVGGPRDVSGLEQVGEHGGEP
jgi:EmrB/QacA subfamily drug resistance transporter